MRNPQENHSHEKALSGIYGVFLFTRNKDTPKRETLDSAYKQGQNSEGLSLLRLESHTTLCEKSMTFLKKHLNFL